MLNGTKTVAIDREYHWRKIDKDTPRGVKLQLIDKSAGVAHYGHYTGNEGFSHWAPLPTFRKQNEITT